MNIIEVTEISQVAEDLKEAATEIKPESEKEAKIEPITKTNTNEILATEKGKENENVIKEVQKPPKSAKKSLNFSTNQSSKIEVTSEPIKKQETSQVKSSEVITKSFIKKSDKESKKSLLNPIIETPINDSILGTKKEPESDFLTLILPLKNRLQDLNASSLKVILAGMRYFDHMSTIKKLLFFQNRSILEQLCNFVHDPMGANWKISTIIDLVSRDPQVDPVLLKNVILKPYQVKFLKIFSFVKSESLDQKELILL